MKNSWILADKEAAKTLISQPSPADFLNYYYHQTKKYWPSFSYAWIAKEMEVSKSLVFGIFNGTKALSSKNITHLIKALKFPKLVEEYFEALVSLPPSPKTNKILKNLREAFLESIDSNVTLAASISDPDFGILYAALGDEDKGVTVEEILKKINWPEERVRFLLNELQIKKFVSSRDKIRFKGTKKFISVVANNQDDWLPKLFHSTLQRHAQLAQKNFFSKDNLSLTYTLCLNEADLIEMNAELKKVMYQVIKKYHDGQGEKIVSVICGTHSN